MSNSLDFAKYSSLAKNFKENVILGKKRRNLYPLLGLEALTTLRGFSHVSLKSYPYSKIACQML